MPCQAAKEFLSSLEIDFEVRDIRRDSGALEELVALGVRATPAIKIGDRVVLGFDPEQIRSALGAEQ